MSKKSITFAAQKCCKGFEQYAPLRAHFINQTDVKKCLGWHFEFECRGQRIKTKT